MAKILFIHGGFGNALLQMAHLNKHEKNFVISSFFTGKIIRFFFGFTDHPNFFNERIEVEDAGILGLAMVPVVFFDLAIAKIFKHSLFTEFDITFIEAKPIFKKLAYFGYFQSNIDLESLIGVGRFLRPNDVEVSTNSRIVIHIRGGDFKDTAQALDHDYYSKALSYIYAQNIFSETDLMLITNDFDYACDILRKCGLRPENIGVSSGKEMDDFDLLHNCNCLISSNSTFALTAALTKPNKKTILLPKGTFDLNDSLDFVVVHV